MDVDIYDFDHTIVPIDSGSRFFVYCLPRYPWIIIFIPFQLIMAIFLITKLISFTTFKKYFFCFIMLIPTEKAVKKFWDKYEPLVFDWFKTRNRFRVIISASPDFLLNEISRRLQFDALICTKHNPKTGAIIGENCRDEEKVKLFHQRFPDAKVIDVYSDSLKHDKPIFSLGKHCIHIVKGTQVPFDFDKVYSSRT